jgi:ABC-2 type transport system permease protein
VSGALRAIGALLWREIARFLRERNRVFGALAQPLIFWALFGAGLGPSFRLAQGGRPVAYAEYFFPGTIVLILLFTAIFSTISLIEDRREGFLQAVLVAPIPRSCLVLGKVLGGTTLAVGQGLLVMALAPLLDLPLSPRAFLLSLPVMALIAFGLTSLSFCIAWRMDSTQGFHAVMTVVLMPLWLLSGAFFPAAGVPRWLGILMACDPLTYGMAAFRHMLAPAEDGGPGIAPGLGAALGLTLLFAAAAFAAALALADRPATGRRA